MSYEVIAIWSRIAGTLVVLAILCYIFARFIAPVIVKAQQAKNAELAAAEQRRDAARDDLDLAIGLLTQATQDADAIRRRVEDEVRREREQALAQTREAGERMLRSASGELDRARVNARDALRVEFIERALHLAEQEAQARIDTARNAELVRDFATSLEAGEVRG